MSKVPDAWEDEWSAVADAPTPSQEAAEEEEPKKISSKVTKAQKRAQQAEFNRQLWAEAEGPKQTNFFLESRNVVPLRQEFKPPPVLLSRKGPKPLSRPRPPPGVDGIANLSILSNSNNVESSEDEDEELAKQSALEARKVLAAKEREEKQRKYEERRLELFGPQTQSHGGQRPTSRSGNSSPGSSTPPQSRSSTPGSNHRGKRGRGGRGGSQLGGQVQAQPRIQQRELLYDQSYSPKPDSTYVQRQEGEGNTGRPVAIGIQPIRAPRGPDGSGRGGFGFANRGGRLHDTNEGLSDPLPSA